MSAAIMRDHPIAELEEKQHLRVPVVRTAASRGEHDRLALAPVLVEDRRAVFGCDGRHRTNPLFYCWRAGVPCRGNGHHRLPAVRAADHQHAPGNTEAAFTIELTGSGAAPRRACRQAGTAVEQSSHVSHSRKHSPCRSGHRWGTAARPGHRAGAGRGGVRRGGALPWQHGGGGADRGGYPRRGRRAAVLPANLAQEAEMCALLPAAAAALGPVGVLVNNAGTFERDAWHDATRESWDRHIEPNLRAPFVLMQDFARALPAAAEGVVINMLDQRVWSLTPHFVSYTVAKAGLWALTQTMALALAPRIRVNGIGPGPALPNPRQTAEQFARQCAPVPLRPRQRAGGGGARGARHPGAALADRTDAGAGRRPALAMEPGAGRPPAEEIGGRMRSPSRVAWAGRSSSISMSKRRRQEGNQSDPCFDVAERRGGSRSGGRAVSRRRIMVSSVERWPLAAPSVEKFADVGKMRADR